MSVAPHSGIIDFGTFVSPTSLYEGIQGEVPTPLAGQQDYVLTAAGWAAGVPGAGTVSSVALSGGTTGLTVSGSPITTSGTMVIGGILNTTNGGLGNPDGTIDGGTY